MTYRGYFALNGVEIANSTRVSAHLGIQLPTSDIEFFNYNAGAYALVEDPTEPGLYFPGPPAGDEDPDEPGLYDVGDLIGDNGLYYPEWAACSLIEDSDHPGLYEIPDECYEVSPGLWSEPNGARVFGPGLFTVDECWGPASTCNTCKTHIGYDDSWPGLKDFLGDTIYRTELAPWYTTELPESAEFGGLWMMSVQGLDSTQVERPVTSASGGGAVAGPPRDRERVISFEALLIACSNAGVEYGLKWLNCLLSATNTTTDTRLRYFGASPAHSAVDPASLLRETHGVILTKSVEVTERINTYSSPNRHANMYRVTWEMTVLSPYVYLPSVPVVVDWDQITRQPINWIHAADCDKPENCIDMPIMFSTECVPETIDRIETPPPVCGGCMPVSGLDKYSFRVPTMDYAFRCRSTAVSTVIRNTGERSLTLQAFWRLCGTDVRCEDNQFPLQVSGLPPGAELHLDAISGRYWAWYDERIRKPIGVVGTPTGAPWRPPLIDRHECWDFIVQTASYSEFDVSMVLSDREA